MYRQRWVANRSTRRLLMFEDALVVFEESTPIFSAVVGRVRTLCSNAGAKIDIAGVVCEQVFQMTYLDAAELCSVVVTFQHDIYFRGIDLGLLVRKC